MGTSDQSFDSIIAHRERRPNAGSRMKKLLALEEAGEAAAEMAMGGDDNDEVGDDVNLLFEEQENDDEFIPSKQRQQAKKTKDTDENFSSDSELTSSDDESDEEAGEKELERQEKEKKKIQRKKRLAIPAIKQNTPARKKQKKAEHKSASASPFPMHRRYSARKSTIAKTEAVQKRWEKEQQQKKQFKPKPKEQYVEKTLEERLEEAKITERENTLALSQYFEREEARKKRQREMAEGRKKKLKQFIRFKSCGVYITPNEEVEEIEKEKKRVAAELEAKNRRKRRRKRVPKEEKKDEPKVLEKDEKKDGKKDENSNEEEKRDDGSNKDDKKDEKKDDSKETSKEASKENLDQKESPEPVEVKSESNEDSVESTEVKDERPPIYEGPAQFVARSYVSFEKFTRKLSDNEVKVDLLGKQAAWPAARRDPRSENIWTIKEDRLVDMNLKKIKARREASFKSLLNFPRFGQKYKLVKQSSEQKSDEEIKINIATPAPVGIYLPNGRKKQCLISDEEAQYYDPGTGVPYNSVECFRILQDMAEGKYSWAQIDRGGINSTFKGGIGCYLGEESTRHAKGVPEGF